MKLIQSLVVAAIVALPVAAMAKKPSAGSYLVSGIQSICIVADGTWYGESFSAWGGTWAQVGKATLLKGNYAAGYGNDGMNFTGSTSLGYNGDWQEWHDDNSYLYAQAATMAFQSSTCSAPAAGVQGGKAHPSQQ